MSNTVYLETDKNTINYSEICEVVSSTILPLIGEKWLLPIIYQYGYPTENLLYDSLLFQNCKSITVDLENKIITLLKDIHHISSEKYYIHINYITNKIEFENLLNDKGEEEYNYTDNEFDENLYLMSRDNKYKFFKDFYNLYSINYLDIDDEEDSDQISIIYNDPEKNQIIIKPSTNHKENLDYIILDDNHTKYIIFQYNDDGDGFIYLLDCNKKTLKHLLSHSSNPNERNYSWEYNYCFSNQKYLLTIYNYYSNGLLFEIYNINSNKRIFKNEENFRLIQARIESFFIDNNNNNKYRDYVALYYELEFSDQKIDNKYYICLINMNRQKITKLEISCSLVSLYLLENLSCIGLTKNGKIIKYDFSILNPT
jgi:hypothetical protein